MIYFAIEDKNRSVFLFLDISDFFYPFLGISPHCWHYSKNLIYHEDLFMFCMQINSKNFYGAIKNKSAMTAQPLNWVVFDNTQFLALT